MLKKTPCEISRALEESDAAHRDLMEQLAAKGAHQQHSIRHTRSTASLFDEITRRQRRKPEAKP